jgi:hypothetical protein
MKKKREHAENEKLLVELSARNKKLRKEYKKALATFTGAQWLAKSLL